MGIKKYTSNSKGFTLVELIVVITILAILGTIAFVSFGSQSASARDSKRKTDLSSLSSKINVVNTNWISYLDMVSTGWTTRALASTGIVAWTWVLAWTDYKWGTINFTVLGVPNSDFKDPGWKDYSIWVSTKAGWVFQIAAKIENTDDWSTATNGALINWNFFRRLGATTTTWSVTFSSWTTTPTVWTITVQSGTPIAGFFRTNDVVLYWSATWVITNVNASLSTLTFSWLAWTPGASWTLSLAWDDTKSLIAKEGTTTPVENNVASPY